MIILSNRDVSGLCDSDDMKTSYDQLSNDIHKYSGILNGVLHDALSYVNTFNAQHNHKEQACLDIAECYMRCLSVVHPTMSYGKSLKIIVMCNSYNDSIFEKNEYDNRELKEFSLQIKSYNDLCMGLIEHYHESEKLLSKEIIKLS